MSTTIEAVKAALGRVVDPNTGKDLVLSKSAKNIQVNNAGVSVDVGFLIDPDQPMRT
jgi:ATP-binding protein involved in chromosome partitioning